MAKRRDKLLGGICDSPKNVRFAEACKAAEKIGFTAKAQVGSSHHAYSKSGEISLLNFQKLRGGKITTYQAKQLIEMIDRYWDFEKGKIKSD